MIEGRIAGLRALGLLLAQRRAIQCGALAARLAAWIKPAPPPWAVLREQRALDTVLRERAGLTRPEQDGTIPLTGD
jgi:hypothetical protein